MLCYLWMLMLMSIRFAIAEIQEICENENFKAQCGNDEVIVIDSAFYGRMKLGRCVKRDFGYLGCSANVVAIADRHCSGRRHCDVNIYKTFNDIKPCSELEAYFEAIYKCKKVSRVIPDVCGLNAKPTTIHSSSGTISSIDAYQKGHGTSRCPYQLQAHPGKRWNITLIDFALADAFPNPDMASDGRPSLCQKYAVIKEIGSNAAVICGGGVREKTVYLSDSNRVTLEIIVGQYNKEAAQFLLHFQAIGCSNPSVPKGAILKREVDKAVISCNITGQRRYLTCEGDTWVGKLVDRCEEGVADANWGIWSALTEDWSSSRGILIVTGLGIALGVVVGIVLLIVALLAMRVRRRRQLRRQQAYASSNGDYSASNMSRKQDSTYGTTYSTDGTMKNREPDYGSQTQTLPLPSRINSEQEERESNNVRTFPELPPPPYIDTSGYGPSQFNPKSEHVYEIPS